VVREELGGVEDLAAAVTKRDGSDGWELVEESTFHGV
jgi:hypothetical protein